MNKQRHSKKEVAAAIEYAQRNGWGVDYGGKSHVCATLYCPGGPECCRPLRVYSTPQNPGNHAKQIIRAIDRCGHQGREEEE